MKSIRAVSIPLMPILAGCASAQVSFTTIGNLPGGIHTSQTSGLSSSDGSVVTGLSSSSNGLLAFRWSPDSGIEALPPLRGTQDYQGAGVSPNGTFISGIHGIPNQQGHNGFVWSEQTGMISVESLPGGRGMTRLGSITDEGLVVGQSDFDFTSTGVPLFRAIRWTPQGGLEAMPLPDPTDLEYQSRSLFVLDDGRIFGQSNSGTWLYSDTEGFEMLPVGSYMRRISSSGDFMMGTKLDLSSLIPHRAMYWTPDTGEVPLAPHGDDYASEALFMSDDGSIIIGRGSLGWLIWSDQGEPILFADFIADLGVDLGGWGINSLTGISANGSTIFGNAGRTIGNETMIEGFALTIPSPGAGAVFFATLGLISVRRQLRDCR